MFEVIVVGAGIGGLVASIELAAAGRRVCLLEAGPRAGGKAGIAVVDGVEFDTGPSLLTMPEVFDAVFQAAGSSLAEEVELLQAEPAFRYTWTDGATVDLHHRLDATLEAIRATFGPAAEAELAGFLEYSRAIWEAASPHFVYGPAPGLHRLREVGLAAFSILSRIDPMRTMWDAIRTRVREPHLRMLLARFATYNGSDVRVVPATLNCIAHVELGLGAYGVRGGIHALVRALEARLRALGGEIRYHTPVRGLRMEGGHITGVETDAGGMDAACVVVNADAALVRAWLGGRGLPAPEMPSASGWNAVLRARRRERAGHAVLFPADYLAEFEDLFDRERPPAVPAVYLCAQEVCHARTGWPEHEPLFVMVNAPPEPPAGTRPDSTWTSLKERTLSRIEGAGLISGEDTVVWERTPADLAEEFPGSRGAIYGAASNSKTAAFRRPPNGLSAVPGLYLASGSAHPGGGLPLCALSGRIAARAILDRR